MSFIYSILAFAIVLGIIVVIHEWGHYIAARMMGVRVEVFSFGFGKRLLGKQVGDTDFRLSLIPLGGYVKMAGEEEWDPDNLKPDEFQAKNRGQKMFILIMGPAMNLVLAFAIYTVLNLAGVMEPAYRVNEPLVGYVAKGSPAEAADIRKGDIIRTIGGDEIPDWKSLDLAIGLNANENLEVSYERNGQLLTSKLDIQPDLISEMGYAGFQWDARSQLSEISKDSPADRAGLEPGDIIVAMDDQPLNHFELISHINAKDGASFKLTVLRDEKEMSFDVTPRKAYRLESPVLNSESEIRSLVNNSRKAMPDMGFGLVPKADKYLVASSDFQTPDGLEGFKGTEELPFRMAERWVIGIIPRPYSPMVEQKYGLISAMKKSVDDIVKQTGLVFVAFKKMIVGKLSAKNLSGPIEIAKISKRAMESGGTNFFMLIAFISLQLGIVNLFPIPALDGGHLMIYSIESILRRDFSQKVKNVLMNIGFLLLITLMAFVILNDIAKTLPNGWSSFFPF